MDYETSSTPIKNMILENNEIYNTSIALGAWEKGIITSDISALRNIICNNNNAGIHIGGYARRL